MNWMRKIVLGSILVRSEIVWAHTDRKGKYQKVIRELLEERKVGELISEHVTRDSHGQAEARAGDGDWCWHIGL